MKKLIFLFGLLFSISTCFVSCKETEREVGETEILEDDTETELGEEGMTDNSFAQYDANRDNQWDENEFTESYQGEFSGYDADTSGDLSNEEFTGATFKSTDRNRDNSIDRQEWDEGYNNSYGEFAKKEDFDRFDTDKSGDLSDAEWNQGFVQSTWFVTYDTDKNKNVSSQEWNRANFSRWDRNDDGFLDQQEFQSYNQSRMGTQSTTTGQNPNTQNNQ